jgi:hypothetical protein
MDQNQLITIVAASLPTMITVLIGILINNARLNDLNSRIASVESTLNRRIDDLRSHFDSRFDEMRSTWTAELHRVEEVIDARLKHLEER